MTTNLTTIDNNDVIYEIDGVEHIEVNEALAVLLANNILIFNKIFWVNCSDFFMWACSDGEEFDIVNILPLYKMFLKDPNWGAQLWTAIRRRELPQDAVMKSILKAGIWDMDAFTQEHNLRANYYSGVTGVESRYKHSICNAWRATQGLAPVAYDSAWWSAWKEYMEANPDWSSDEYKVEVSERIAEWKTLNGWT